mmetsp:Transcript_1162/g.2318  ORF Transcript_1162/g.2318 Transcript_1162/m.2318 type:complete len:168 (+) Transcript_1162:482-985(+)
MAQAMSRLQLNWLGSKDTPINAGNTFRTILILLCAYYTVVAAWSYIFPGAYTNDENGEEIHIPDPLGTFLINTLQLIFFVWSLVALTRTRKYLREKYEIPEERCHGFEDLVCSFCCSMCTVAQMNRHTADYDNYDSMCCTENGLSQNTPTDPIATGRKIENSPAKLV